METRMSIFAGEGVHNYGRFFHSILEAAMTLLVVFTLSAGIVWLLVWFNNNYVII